MELNSIIKLIGQMSLRSDFKEYFVKSSAEGEFLKSEFEEVENDQQIKFEEE